MNKLPKTAVISIIVCMLIFCLGLGWAVHVRAGYSRVFEPVEENTSELKVLIKRSDAEVNGMRMPGSARELIKGSDTVIIAEVGESRSFIGQHPLTTVKVIKTLSGEVPDTEEIFVYEPAEFIVNMNQDGFGGYVRLNGAAMLLHYGKWYVLTLDHVEYPEGYNENERERRTYLYSFSGCSAFPYDNEPHHIAVQLDGTDEALNVGQLAGVYYYSDEKTIETCLRLYDQIMEAFSKGD